MSVKPRLLYLDGLRGLAVLMVMVYHIWRYAGFPSWWIRVGSVPLNLMAPVEALGGSRVSLFFVLSGFLLYLPFGRARSSTASPESKAKWDAMPLTTWLWRRFHRLCPPYWAAIALSVGLVFGLFALNNVWFFLNGLPPRPLSLANLPTALPASLIFMHGMVPGSEWPMFNVPLWTMTPEVQLYLAFPLLLLIARRKSLQAAVILAVVACMLARLWLFARQDALLTLPGCPAVSIYPYFVNTFLGRWAEFAFGMGAAGLVAAQRLPSARLVAPTCGGMLTLYFFLRAHVASFPALTPWLDVLGGAGYALLVLACASTPRLARLFSCRPLVALGVLSFSLYLTHWLIITLLNTFFYNVFHLDYGMIPFTLKLCLGVPLMLVAARVFWQVCERPFLSAEAQATLPRVGLSWPGVETVASGIQTDACAGSRPTLRGVLEQIISLPPKATASSSGSSKTQVPWLRIGCAVGLVALTHLALPYAGWHPSSILPGFTFAVLLSAWIGGQQGALFAVWIAALLACYNLPPQHSFSIASPYRFGYGLFLVTCGIISLYRPLRSSLRKRKSALGR